MSGKFSHKKINQIILSAVVVLLITAAVLGVSAIANGSPENPLSDESYEYRLSAEDKNGDKGDFVVDQDESSDSLDNSILTDDSSNSSDSSVDESQISTNNQPTDDSHKNDNVESGNSSGTNGNILPELPNKDSSQQGQDANPITNEEVEEYFSTTIVDGEIVTARDYYFEIFQLTDTTVKDVFVRCNSNLVTQFKGNCLLNEGSNTIRVQVDYIDIEGKVISVYKDYTVVCVLDKAVIDTNLQNKTVDTDGLSFYAYGYVGKQRVICDVYLNDSKLQGDGNFTCTLAEGDNNIRIECEDASLEYIITYEKPAQLHIETDLENCSVNQTEFSFTAKATGGSGAEKLTVSVNGKNCSGNGNYTCTLNIGSNTIHLKAKDGDKIVSKTVTVRYVPIADEKTAPKIDFINVTNGMSVNGQTFTINVMAKDYNGDRIYASNISLTLNGAKKAYTWDSSYTSYFLTLVNGKNTISIRVTDKDGRYSDYTYEINCTAVKDGDPIGTITISLDANVLGLGYIIEPCGMTIYQGENEAQLMLRLLEENDITYTYSGTLQKGFYLSRIARADIALEAEIPQDLIDAINIDGLEWKDQKYKDSIGEFDYCQGSGWVGSVNGLFLNRGFSDTYLQDGDVVQIRYTLAYGKDVGGYISEDGEGNYGKVW